SSASRGHGRRNGGVSGPKVLAQLATAPQVLHELGGRPPPVHRLLALPAPERDEVPGILRLTDQDEPLRPGGLALRPLCERRPPADELLLVPRLHLPVGG